MMDDTDRTFARTFSNQQPTLGVDMEKVCLFPLTRVGRTGVSLSKHSDAKKLDLSGSFNPSQCCSLAFCIHQGIGKQAFHMHSNVVKCLKPLIRAIRQPKKKKGESLVPSNAKKTKPVYPEARTLLDKGFAVLKIESVASNCSSACHQGSSPRSY